MAGNDVMGREACVVELLMERAYTGRSLRQVEIVMYLPDG